MTDFKNRDELYRYAAENDEIKYNDMVYRKDHDGTLRNKIGMSLYPYDSLDRYEKVKKYRMIKFYRPTSCIDGCAYRATDWVNKERHRTDGKYAAYEIVDWHENDFLELPVDKDGEVLWDEYERSK